MIVFRVGSDDAEFLEKEFEPEFTPQDIVNLPNYKIYLKLMIDGVTSRPFSARTLPQMVKSGNREVEDEVIKSSRKLYCRPREEVEIEINSWSGMSLGNEDDSSGGNLEKFPTICSLCKKETTVPFKPEPGRTVYCKECMAKIKSGEVKVSKNNENQIKYDDSKFFRPLADLGIEFEQKEYVSSVISNANSVSKSKKFSKYKPVQKAKENSGLKEMLDSLKEKTKDLIVRKPTRPSADRAASAEDMNKLKELIKEKIEDKQEETQPAQIPKTKEVPEDVLRKILEE